MMGRGLWISLAVTWGGRRALALPAGLALLWLFSGFTNPWDLLLFSVKAHEIVLILIPLYLVILSRDLRSPWEALVAIRLGRARTWWGGHVGAAAVSAILVAVGLAILVIAVPVVAHGWTWQWGPYARGSETPAIMASPAWRVPWRWGLEALGLLTLGLWAMGVLMHGLGLWWRSPWAAWIVVVLLSFVADAVKLTALQTVLWWLPGPQFSLSQHWLSQGIVAPGWSVAYAIALLTAVVGTGLAMAEASPWDASHGGTV
ncbi:MAG: hypothetical protein ACYCVA_01415 [Sulfobacillus sp.]